MSVLAEVGLVLGSMLALIGLTIRLHMRNRRLQKKKWGGSWS